MRRRFCEGIEEPKSRFAVEAIEEFPWGRADAFSVAVGMQGVRGLSRRCRAVRRKGCCRGANDAAIAADHGLVGLFAKIRILEGAGIVNGARDCGCTLRRIWGAGGPDEASGEKARLICGELYFYACGPEELRSKLKKHGNQAGARSGRRGPLDGAAQSAGMGIRSAAPWDRFGASTRSTKGSGRRSNLVPMRGALVGRQDGCCGMTVDAAGWNCRRSEWISYGSDWMRGDADLRMQQAGAQGVSDSFSGAGGEDFDPNDELKCWRSGIPVRRGRWKTGVRRTW